LIHDTWASLELQKAADAVIRDITEKGGDWLASIPVIEPIDLSDAPVVLLIDALAPDIWVETQKGLSPFLGEGRQSWARLDAPTSTVPAMQSLFGIDNKIDPAESFDARNIVYDNIEGNESAAIADLMPPLLPGSASIIRLGLLDRAAHTGGMRLCDLPGLLYTVLSNNLSRLVEMCGKHKRRLVLTTDHGLTFSKKGLSHGNPGVFEQAIIRVEWR
jgi:hypothetical protein